jgi:hypothetical protein
VIAKKAKIADVRPITMDILVPWLLVTVLALECAEMHAIATNKAVEKSINPRNVNTNEVVDLVITNVVP